MNIHFGPETYFLSIRTGLCDYASRANVSSNCTCPSCLLFDYGNREWDYVGSLLKSTMIRPFPHHFRPGGGVISLAGWKPETLPYDRAFDRSTYGSILGNVGLALNLLNGGLSPKNENRVQHVTLEGECLYGDAISYRTGDETIRDVLGYQLREPRYNSPYLINSQSFPAPNPIFWAEWGDHAFLEDVLWVLQRKFPSGEEWDHTTTVAGNDTCIRVVSIDHTTLDTGFLIQYRHVVRRAYSDQPIEDYWNEVEISTSVFFNPDRSLTPSASTTFGFHYPGLRWGSVIGEDSVSEKVFNHPPDGPVLDHDNWGYGFDSMTTECDVNCRATGRAAREEPPQAEIDELYTTVYQSLQDIASDPRVYGAAYMSSGKAINDFDRLIDSNYIESLSELDQILSLVPDIAPIDEFIRLIPKGELLAGAVQMMDFATDMVLLVNFGLGPFVDDIQTFASSWDELRRRLGRLSAGRRKLYGMFTYQFSDDDDLQLDGFKLEVRSKVVVDFPDYSITLALSPFRNAGLNVAASAFWDLVPFSFVVDWFYNIGQRMEMGEAALSMATARVNYCVHSYTITGSAVTLPRDTSPLFNLEEVRFKVYRREVSQFYPGVSQSAFDWFKPQNGPPMFIGGSLLYKLI